MLILWRVEGGEYPKSVTTHVIFVNVVMPIGAYRLSESFCVNGIVIQRVVNNVFIRHPVCIGQFEKGAFGPLQKIPYFIVPLLCVTLFFIDFVIELVQ